MVSINRIYRSECSTSSTREIGNLMVSKFRGSSPRFSSGALSLYSSTLSRAWLAGRPLFSALPSAAPCSIASRLAAACWGWAGAHKVRCRVLIKAPRSLRKVQLPHGVKGQRSHPALLLLPMLPVQPHGCTGLPEARTCSSSHRVLLEPISKRSCALRSSRSTLSSQKSLSHTNLHRHQSRE